MAIGAGRRIFAIIRPFSRPIAAPAANPAMAANCQGKEPTCHGHGRSYGKIDAACQKHDGHAYGCDYLGGCLPEYVDEVRQFQKIGIQEGDEYGQEQQGQDPRE